ncbi:acetate kinase [Patescibacteria group bacterium]|nr:acetate kinase [Patescibacteria group bacterium]
MKQKQYILIINAGSATIKFQILHEDSFEVALKGIFERIGSSNSFYSIKEQTSNRIVARNFPQGVETHKEALEIVLDKISHWQRKIKIVGHRVVHGGEEFKQATKLNQNVLHKLKKYSQLAPLHNPINLACINVCLDKFSKNIKNIAVFDTSFYQSIPDYAYMYALPYQYYTDYGIRRYGFHGISHQYVAEQAAEKLKKPLKKIHIITCHLGSGSSITATKFGKAIETSMGFTPLEGLTMGTRSGDVDPAVALYLMKKLNIRPTEMENILNKKSGLLGIFGYSNDMRDVMVASGYKIPGYKAPKQFNKSEQARAKLALEMFVYDIKRYIGSFAAIMGGVDVIVFTAGIGERNAIIRGMITRNLKLNQKFKTIVIPTNEELMIAKEAIKVI